MTPEGCATIRTKQRKIVVRLAVCLMFLFTITLVNLSFCVVQLWARSVVAGWLFCLQRIRRFRAVPGLVSGRDCTHILEDAYVGKDEPSAPHDGSKFVAVAA